MENMKSPEHVRPGSDNGSRVSGGILFPFPSFLQVAIRVPDADNELSVGPAPKKLTVQSDRQTGRSIPR